MANGCSRKLFRSLITCIYKLMEQYDKGLFSYVYHDFHKDVLKFKSSSLYSTTKNMIKFIVVSNYTLAQDIKAA